MLSKPYIIVPLSHTGHGKSQLCNFIIKDLNNSKFKVNPGFDSQTKDPQCELFNRKIDNEVFQLELIDTAGCGDTAKEDEENFKKLIDKLKEKKYVDLFLLVFNFREYRIDGPTREYIKLIANTFTPTEFYNHLAIIFTQYPEHPTEEDKKNKKLKTAKIRKLIVDIIRLSNEQNAISPDIYELDTKIYNGKFIPKFQATIDLILIKMKDIINLIGPVNTENIRYLGVKDRLKEEQKKLQIQKLEFERLKKLQEEKKRIYEEIMKRREAQIKTDEENNKRERESLNRGWSDLARAENEFEKKKAKHKQALDNINKIIKEYQVEIDNLGVSIEEDNKLISEDKRKISEENWNWWKGGFKIGWGILWTPLKIINIDYGIRKTDEGIDILINAENNIKKFEEDKKNHEDMKLEHENKKQEKEKQKQNEEIKRENIEKIIDELNENENKKE